MTTIPQELIERVAKALWLEHINSCAVLDTGSLRDCEHEWESILSFLDKASFYKSAEAAIRAMMPKLNWEYGMLFHGKIFTQYTVRKNNDASFACVDGTYCDFKHTYYETRKAAKTAAEQAYLKHWGGVE